VKKFFALVLVALAVACNQGTAPTEPQLPPIGTPIPTPVPTATPAPAGCTFTGIQIINGVCYRCTNGVAGTIACPTVPSPTPTAVAPTPPPTPAPAQCDHEGQQWAVGGPNGPVCYFCHFGQALEVPCAPAPTPTPSGCVSPVQPGACR
jgi:hypothetical protein